MFSPNGSHKPPSASEALSAILTILQGLRKNFDDLHFEGTAVRWVLGLPGMCICVGAQYMFDFTRIIRVN